jgi:hypothetical protein
MEKNLCELFLRISPDKFHFIKFILEGYDNLALISSVSGEKGVIRLRYPEENLREVLQLLSSIAPEIKKERFEII